MPKVHRTAPMFGGSLKAFDDSTVQRALALMRDSTRLKYAPIWTMWIEHHKRIEASPLDAAEFIERCKSRQGLNGEKLSRATLKVYVCALYKLYQVLAEEKQVERNPFNALWAEYKSMRVAQRRPTEMIPFDRVMALIDAPPHDTRIGRRDRTILALLFGGGLRRSEIAKLKMRDVVNNCDGLALTLRETKNKSDAVQALADWCCEILQSYIEQRWGENAKADSPLITDYTKYDRAGTRHISDDLIYLTFKRWAAHIGLPAEASPHWARATAVTKLLADGVPHREVQEFSRHASVSMVERYDKRRIGGEKHPGRKLNFTVAKRKKSE